MQTERIPVADVSVGDLVETHDLLGWFAVGRVSVSGQGVELGLDAVESNSHVERRFALGDVVRRGEPDAVHHRDEFLGLAIGDAEALAASIGWQLRNRSVPGFLTNDLRQDRINVWTDEAGVVTRTKFG